MLGRDAEIVESALKHYRGDKIKLISTNRDPNTTKTLYQISESKVEILYNKYNESTLIGEDIPNQERCNIGITIIGGDIEKTKNTLEKIVGIKLESSKNKQIIEKGIK